MSEREDPDRYGGASEDLERNQMWQRIEQRARDNAPRHHLVREESTGSGIGDTRTPVCSCGWRGRPEGNWNDWQHENLREQQKAHLRAVEGL
jgi:hypothetical protein